MLAGLVVDTDGEEVVAVNERLGGFPEAEELAEHARSGVEERCEGGQDKLPEGDNAGGV